MQPNFGFNLLQNQVCLLSSSTTGKINRTYLESIKDISQQEKAVVRLSGKIKRLNNRQHKKMASVAVVDMNHYQDTCTSDIMLSIGRQKKGTINRPQTSCQIDRSLRSKSLQQIQKLKY